MINGDLFKARDNAVYWGLCKRAKVLWVKRSWRVGKETDKIGRCFKPYFSFKKVAGKKEMPVFDEDNTTQSNLPGWEQININAVEIPVGSSGIDTSKKETMSESYRALVNLVIWNGLSTERFWLIYGR